MPTGSDPAALGADVDKVLLLASGGLDSTTMAYWLRAQGIRVRPLFIDYGQHCAKTELDTLFQVMPRDIAKEISTVDLTSVYTASRSRLINEARLWQEAVEPGDLYLPYRNLLFLSVAAARAQSSAIRCVCAAFINSNHAVELDCSAAFFDSLTTFLAAYGSVAVRMPFRDMAKADVIRLALELGSPIGDTYSCQVSSSVPCGACPNCTERLDALRSVAGRTR